MSGLRCWLNPARFEDRLDPGAFPRRRIPPVLPAALVISLAAAARGPAQAIPPRTVEVFIDPALGSDDAGAGTAASPFRSLTRAAIVPGAEPRCILRLAAGRYSAESGEVFPISLPAGPVEMEIIGPASGQAILSIRDRVPAALQVWIRGAASALERLDIRGVRFEGGDAAVSVLASDRKLSLAIDDCEFHGQKLQGLELAAGELGELDAAVEQCRFSGSPLYAIDLGTQPRSRLGFQVRSCRLAGGLPGSSLPPAAGIALFLDREASIAGSLERNIIADFTSGILVVAPEPERGRGGSLELEVANNLVRGEGSRLEGGSTHGAYLALHPGNTVRARWSHNTFLGGSGHGVHIEEPPADLTPDQLCAALAVEFTANVIWGYAGGVLNLAEAGAAVPPCFSFRANALVESRLADGGENLAVREEDFEWLDGIPRPAAGSPLIDAAPPGSAGGSGIDLDGRCRTADGDGDGVFRSDPGAFEAAGPCADGAEPFIRGDCDHSGLEDISDAITALGYLFLGEREPPCLDACDSNDDGALDITDGVAILGYLFLGSQPPPPPFPAAGLDPTPDPLPVCLKN